jgi:hypothetical protein
MANESLFQPSDLEALCLSGEERILSALASGDRSRIAQTFADVDAAYREFREIYHGWAAMIFEFLLADGGFDALKKATPMEGPLAAAAAAGIDGERIRAVTEAPARFEARVAAGDPAGARAVVREQAEAARELHDWYRDWVSSLLSHVYRELGVDGLERCLRASSERGWMPWMMEDVTHDPRTRLRDWTRLLAVGNFATISIEEEDDKFVIVQHPCGSCGRQDEGDRTAPPWNLAVVRERHPITWGRGGVSAYRTHIAVMHTLMPIERIGAPWPLMHCPRAAGEPCTIHFYKDARHVDPEDLARTGLGTGGPANG